ncbi:monooxygenase [Mycolicibacterium sp. CH28]|uniref:flavin-containing monooxygenase n=1 Tax=Mycolicibacterium sp. CH28 TaxID=2512237 RepID=UPI0010808FC7|nr:NAD(P)-binding domain-containing protein [Mycolicibacterium sp. CH28]TGD88241.1 monooxygenase [Mycolicibacterium sp. CH28]
MKIAIIGAGVAGLSSAKLLTEFGFEVAIFEKAPDIGGVWSRTRLYPGVTTQNGKDTYAFSDFPMPEAYPEWPTGAQVQQYLAAYAHHFDLGRLVRLNTEVVSAELDEVAGRWTLTTRGLGAGTTDQSEFDQLIVATGIFCDPFIPDYPGIEEFSRAGGRVCAASEFNDLQDAVDKDIVVVGYGKSSCDIAEALSDVAQSTTVAAREVTWKMPRKLGGVLNYKYLLLTRLTEALFEHIDQRGFARVITGPGRSARNALLGVVERITRRQLMFDQLGLVPEGPFDRIVRHAVSLATEGFYEKIRDGVIDMRRGVSITGLHDKDGVPTVEFSDGTTRRVDAVVCATGYQQRTPFLPEDLRARITDSNGNFQLYRQILPIDVPRLFFVGYGSSLLSPISAEAAAIWVVNYLAGDAELPPLDQQRAFAERRLNWMIERTEGKHAHGTNIIPFSVRQIDEILDEVGVNVGWWTQLRQWLLPIRPAAYQAATRALHRRIDGKTGARHSEPRAIESTI